MRKRGAHRLTSVKRHAQPFGVANRANPPPTPAMTIETPRAQADGPTVPSAKQIVPSMSADRLALFVPDAAAPTGLQDLPEIEAMVKISQILGPLMDGANEPDDFRVAKQYRYGNSHSRQDWRSLESDYRSRVDALRQVANLARRYDDDDLQNIYSLASHPPAISPSAPVSFNSTQKGFQGIQATLRDIFYLSDVQHQPSSVLKTMRKFRAEAEVRGRLLGEATSIETGFEGRVRKLITAANEAATKPPSGFWQGFKYALLGNPHKGRSRQMESDLATVLTTKATLQTRLAVVDKTLATMSLEAQDVRSIAQAREFTKAHVLVVRELDEIIRAHDLLRARVELLGKRLPKNDLRTP